MESLLAIKVYSYSYVICSFMCHIFEYIGRQSQQFAKKFQFIFFKEISNKMVTLMPNIYKNLKA